MSRSTGRGLRWNKWERTVTGNHRAGRHICRPYEPADDLRHSETNAEGSRPLPTGLQKPSPLGEGGPAGPDEGETARQQPFAYNVRAGRARPLRTGG